MAHPLIYYQVPSERQSRRAESELEENITCSIWERMGNNGNQLKKHRLTPLYKSSEENLMGNLRE